MTRANETIRRINSIIQVLHIPLEVKKTDIYKNKIFSLVLYDKEYPNAFSSGCGFSYTEAMACALGEFIERLQNGLLYDEFHFCQSITAFEKNIVMNIPSCSINKKFLLFPSSNKTACYKYKNIFNNKIEYIPVAYIKQNCGSSGMAAGVSLEEAIQNGLKEVVERYICKMIYTKKVSKLTMGYYNYDKFIARENKDLITELKNDGFSLQIIDLSLNFKFPVLGVFLKEELIMNYKILKAGKLYDDAEKIMYDGCKCSYQGSGTAHALLIDKEIGVVSSTTSEDSIRKSKDVA